MDLMTIVIAAVLVLVIAGILIGLFFALRGGQKSPPPQKPGAGHPGLVEVARLGRDKTTDMLLVVVDGKLVTRASELSAGQRNRLSAAANDLQKWLGQPVTATSPAATPSFTTERMPTPPPAFTSMPSEAEIGIPGDVKPVAANPVEALRHTMGPSKPAPSFISIPAQIEEILQAKLAGTPLEKRGIHLIESPNQGVIVHIGLEQYPGIDAVPDEEVRNIIRSAVAEWEKRNR